MGPRSVQFNGHVPVASVLTVAAESGLARLAASTKEARCRREWQRAQHHDGSGRKDPSLAHARGKHGQITNRKMILEIKSNKTGF